MPYNPNIHHRRSIRLKGYDYSKEGLYFITICCENRICRFGKIIVGAGLAPALKMVLNEYGQIAYNEWLKLPERFANFELDVFQIMPNHIHGIIVLNDIDGSTVGATLAVAQNIDQNDAHNNAVAQNDDFNITDKRAGASPAPTVGDIVGAYKSLVANECLEIFKSENKIMGKWWQRNYHEHIIRDEQSYQRISEYIINNPAKWTDDKFYNQESSDRQ
jgi:putative transposase